MVLVKDRALHEPKRPPPQANPRWRSKRQGLLAENPDIDFNSDHDFTIEITFDSYYVPVSIRINDWEIIIEEAVLPFFSPIKYMPEQRMSGRDQRMIELPDFLQSDLLHYPFGASVG